MRLRVLIALGLVLSTLGCTLAAESAPVDYAAAKARLIAYRDSAGTAYAAQGPEAKARSLRSARTRLIDELDKAILPAWNGTAWDFNGVSQEPGKGAIACGYFITTVLRDAGFMVERARMAQQASLFIIRSLSPKEERRDWSYLSPAQFADKMKAMPHGLYVVGLDIHTGFVLNRPQGVYFIHSSYMKPGGVLREKAGESAVLGASKRFVLGRVDNDWLMDKWLRKEKVETVTG